MYMEIDRNLTLALLDYQNGTLQLTGQHEEVLLVHKNGEIERIDIFDLGFIVGLEPDISRFVASEEITLQSGDGIIEAINIEEQQYGLEYLCEVVSNNWSGNSKKIQQFVITDVKNHIGDQKVFDDITLLILKQI